MEIETTGEALPILRALLALGRRLRAERPAGGVTLSSVSVLGTLARLGPILATHLAAEERLQPQSLTRILAELEKQYLIRRERSADDRRASPISLTEKGHAVLAADLAARREWLEGAMAATLDAEERALLAAAARVMLKLAFHTQGKKP